MTVKGKMFKSPLIYGGLIFTIFCVGAILYGFISARMGDVQTTNTAISIKQADLPQNFRRASSEYPANSINMCLNICDCLPFKGMEVSSYYHYKPADIKLTTSNIVFCVRRDRDAHIALLIRKLRIIPRQMFEVVIGGHNNQKSTIRNAKHKLSLINWIPTPGVLSTTKYRPFWLSWDSTTINFGKGREVGADELISANHTTPLLIQYVAVSAVSGSWCAWKF